MRTLACRIVFTHVTTGRVQNKFNRQCSSEMALVYRAPDDSDYIKRLGDYLPSTAIWGYEKHNGPHLWANRFKEARGTHQSPVDIITSRVERNSGLLQHPLEWKFFPEECKTLLNVGCGWKVYVIGDKSYLTGGPLEHIYRLTQFHCHWGPTNDAGSEHTVDGKPYAAELHLVFWNQDLYTRALEASCSKQGLAVLGLFLKVGKEHPELQKLCTLMRNIRFRDQTVPIPDGIDLEKLLPEDHAYFTYEGSLTTPPCHESVTWLLFERPIEVSQEQLDTFRLLNLFCSDSTCPSGEFGGRILRNFRPTQDLNGRIIMTC